ncbi:MAG TPA: thioredoxin domain-containing protein [Polyangia bacterium]|nr:thioredoxin domain-containing protein [Polyangia bacterium]
MTTQAESLAERPDDHARGPRDATIVIVEYGDYACPHTRRAHLIVTSLLASFGPHDQPRFVFRHFPLRELHPDAELLSELVEAASTQGKFWEMHDRLMSHRAALGRDDLAADAAVVGLDLASLNALVGTPALKSRVEADVRSGRSNGVHSTPSFFFNGVLHDGHYDAPTLRARLEDARRR